MKVFMDTEFTDLRIPKLISIGLVSEDGERSFYAELPGNYENAVCSDFVIDTVLPLLDAPTLTGKINYRTVYAKMTMDECRQHLDSWFACIQEPTRIYTDAPHYDFALLKAIFNGYPWPALVDTYPHLPALGECEWMQFDSMTDRIFANQPFRRHHALDDAQAMCLAFLQAKTESARQP
jgi:hypothetical protein